MPRVSVVIPTYNRLPRLKQVLAALERQTYPLSNFEVVVVSDGATDGTDEYLQTLTTPLNLTLATQPNAGVAATRNHGIRRARGDLILFIDDDVVPTTTLLAEHVAVHDQQADDVVVLGTMLTPPDATLLPWVHWEQLMLEKQYAAMQRGDWQPTARQFYTGNTSLLRRRLVAAGGFDETFRRAEDIELAYRLADEGMRFIFHYDAIGYHYAERSFRSWSEIPYVYGRNDVIFARDKRQYWILPVIRREFYRRSAATQLLVRACLGRKYLTHGVLTVLRQASGASQHVKLARVSRFAHSGIFNLRYYQGVADELGGREAFRGQVW